MKGKLLIKNGVVLNSAPNASHVVLPHKITSSFVKTWFSLPIQDPCSVGRLSSRILHSDARRLADAAQALGGEVYLRWLAEARKWPQLTQSSDSWTLVNEDVVFHQHLTTTLISDVYITARDVRLVRIDGDRLVSAAQFELLYDQTVAEHLNSHVDKTVDKVRIIIDALSAPLRVASVVGVSEAGEVLTVKAIGPASIPAKHWELPDGITFLNED